MPFLHRTVTLFLLIVTLLVQTLPASAAPTAQSPADWAIPGGRFFTQTGSGQGGFSVTDDSQARFWTEFQRLGGLQNVGYPISRRFTYDGFVTQAFQKLVLQWRPEVSQAWPVNVFDELDRKGFNETLYRVRQTPYPLTNFDAPGASWMQIIRARQALLDANPAIRARYFATADPMNVYGLPVSRVEDMGNHYALRTQRAVFQQWKEAVPWAAAGQVTIANGGDIGKELGWLAGAYLQPEPLPHDGGDTTSWLVESLKIVLVGTAPRVYALQVQLPDYQTKRLMMSDDLGATWRPFDGPLPVNPSCITGLSDDNATTGVLFLNTCQGLYYWNQSGWVRWLDQRVTESAIAYAHPFRVWAISDQMLRYSGDNGSTWSDVARPAPLLGLALDPRDNQVLYATTQTLRGAPTGVVRRNADGTWVELPLPANQQTNGYLAVDPQSGDLYATTITTIPSQSYTLWRSVNPREASSASVRWEAVHTFGGTVKYGNAHVLDAARVGSDLVMFATLLPFPGGSRQGQLMRSTDGGQSWLAIPTP